MTTTELTIRVVIQFGTGPAFMALMAWTAKMDAKYEKWIGT